VILYFGVLSKTPLFLKKPSTTPTLILITKPAPQNRNKGIRRISQMDLSPRPIATEYANTPHMVEKVKNTPIIDMNPPSIEGEYSNVIVVTVLTKIIKGTKYWVR
jgi:hypothetical protein